MEQGMLRVLFRTSLRRSTDHNGDGLTPNSFMRSDPSYYYFLYRLFFRLFAAGPHARSCVLRRGRFFPLFLWTFCFFFTMFFGGPTAPFYSK